MRGFTLLELLVVVAVMAVILTIVAIPGYNQYSRNQKLMESTSQLQSILRQAQNNAQTGTVCKIGSSIYTASSWNVSLSKDNYSVFPACVGTPLVPATKDYTLSGVNISKIKNKSTFCEATTLPVTISYKNLSSEVIFDLPGCFFDINEGAEIILNLTGTSSNETIVVEKGGGIYVKE